MSKLKNLSSGQKIIFLLPFLLIFLVIIWAIFLPNILRTWDKTERESYQRIGEKYLREHPRSTYQDDSLGLSFDYPSGWKLTSGRTLTARYIDIVNPDASEESGNYIPNIRILIFQNGYPNNPSNLTPTKINNIEGVRGSALNGGTTAVSRVGSSAPSGNRNFEPLPLVLCL